MAVILVADDDSMLRATMRKMLEASGHAVLEATSGREAEEIVARERVDLLITDIIMPEKEGIGLVRDVKRLRPELRIIAMSGGGRSGQFGLLEVATKFGADAALQKPFRRDALSETIAQLLGTGGKASAGSA